MVQMGRDGGLRPTLSFCENRMGCKDQMVQVERAWPLRRTVVLHAVRTRSRGSGRDNSPKETRVRRWLHLLVQFLVYRGPQMVILDYDKNVLLQPSIRATSTHQKQDNKPSVLLNGVSFVIKTFHEQPIRTYTRRYETCCLELKPKQTHSKR